MNSVHFHASFSSNSCIKQTPFLTKNTSQRSSFSIPISIFVPLTSPLFQCTKIKKLLNGEKNVFSPRKYNVFASVNNDDLSKNLRNYPLPESVNESIDQARASCQRAISDGANRILLEILLPLIGATDLDDWPGGIQQQFKAASPLVTSLLKGLVKNDKIAEVSKSDDKFTFTILDEGDAVGLWENETIALVLFPTADVYKKIKSLSENPNKTILLVNPQWNSGQVISDFGFGPWKKEKENFFNSFIFAYSLKRMRMRSEDVRIFKCYPNDWKVYVANEFGNSILVSTEEVYPPYKRLESILKNQTVNGPELNILDRVKKEFKFNKDSLN